MIREHIKKNELRQGYLLSGGSPSHLEAALEAACSLLGCERNELKSQADFYFQESPLFTIKESRLIKEKSFLSASLPAGRRVFVIKTESLTNEAANALLKIFEEPPPGVYFFLIVPRLQSIPDTLRSRLFVIDESPSQEAFEEGKEAEEAEKFLSAFPDERQKMVKDICKRDRAELISFLRAVEVFVEKNLDEESSNKKAFILKEIGWASQTLRHRFSFPKMVIERLALILPKV